MDDLAYSKLWRRYTALQQKHQEAVRLLKALEWSRAEETWIHRLLKRWLWSLGVCPWCRRSVLNGHTRHCSLYKLIRTE